MIGMVGSGDLSPDLVFDPFYVDAADENLAVEHDRDASLIRGDPNRSFIHSFRVAILHQVLDPRNDLESIDPTGGDLDRFSALNFQIQQIAIFSSENIEIKMVAHFEILAPGKVDRGDRVNGIGRLIEFVFLHLGSLVAMDRPFLRVSVELGLSVNNFSVFPLTESETGRCKRLRLDG